jgi:capsular polysaccharide biosynthesis protein
MTSEAEESMNSAPWSAKLPRMSPTRAFATVFLAVFLFIFLSSALVTFMLPETYGASARVVAPDAADLQVFQSAELLKEVSQQLNLPETYAARYGEKKPLEDKRVEDFLRRSVQVRRLAGTDLIEIRVYSRSPAESVQLANEIAGTGARQARHGSGSFRIVERAVPPIRPSRPNKPLNLALGAVVGIFLGTMAGGVGARLAVGFEGPRSTTA